MPFTCPMTCGGIPAAFASRKQDSGGNRNIEGIDVAGRGDAHEEIAPFADKAVEARCPRFP